MDFLIDGSVGAAGLAVLAFGLLCALGFEFANGFHDTANAVATEIYTHSLKPVQAVIWSGCWNFVGVLTSSGAVAFGIVALLPAELIVQAGSPASLAMIFALLASAILWNVGTWYLGLPASSSHTLIGSIIGVGLMNAITAGDGWIDGVNWDKLRSTMLALLISPVVGFVASALLLLLARRFLRNPVLHQPPEEQAPPPFSIRALLIATCTGVSFAHGSNDGQKGIGLIMLVLISLAPAAFALQLSTSPERLSEIVEASRFVAPMLAKAPVPGPIDNDIAETHLEHYVDLGRPDAWTLPSLAVKNDNIRKMLTGITSLRDLSPEQRTQLRRDIYLIDEAADEMVKSNIIGDDVAAAIDTLSDKLIPLTEFIPVWVKVAVALALGLGTMIGWKRIVVTIGEKIGKGRLTYAQGATAELVTMSTISLADVVGLPVSTTHILSSGVAGAMFAGHSGLQSQTVRNILLAWVLTVPATMLLGSALFAASLYMFLRLLG